MDRTGGELREHVELLRNLQQGCDITGATHEALAAAIAALSPAIAPAAPQDGEAAK